MNTKLDRSLLKCHYAVEQVVIFVARAISTGTFSFRKQHILRPGPIIIYDPKALISDR